MFIKNSQYFTIGIKKILYFLLFIGFLAGNSIKKEPLVLTHNNNKIRIQPGAIIKLNGKKVKYNGYNTSNRSVNLNFIDEELSNNFRIDNINEIRLINEDSLLSNINKYSSRGFRHGLFLSKIFSLGAVYFINERHENEYSELTNDEKNFVIALIIPPVFGGLIGGIFGLIDYDKQHSSPMYIENGKWEIIN